MKTNFEKYIEKIIIWEELELNYFWKKYWITNWKSENWKNYYYFSCDWTDFLKEICLFEEKEKLIEFAKNYKIEWNSLKKNFDEKLYDEEKFWF